MKQKEKTIEGLIEKFPKNMGVIPEEIDTKAVSVFVNENYISKQLLSEKIETFEKSFIKTYEISCPKCHYLFSTPEAPHNENEPFDECKCGLNNQLGFEQFKKELMGEKDGSN